MSLSAEIEVWLLTQTDWVSASVICAHFQVNERDLRASGKRSGLLSEFAISGDKGFKHIRNATDQEFLSARARILSHLKHEARRLRLWKDRRQHELIGLRPHQAELFTGQQLLPV